jgi:hypothetical protein
MKISCTKDVHICRTNFAKKIEQNLHETISWWKTYGNRLFFKDLELQDVAVANPHKRIVRVIHLELGKQQKVTVFLHILRKKKDSHFYY